MITTYKEFPIFKTAGEYYHAAMKFQASPKGVLPDSRYLKHLWDRFDELHVEGAIYPKKNFYK